MSADRRAFAAAVQLAAALSAPEKVAGETAGGGAKTLTVGGFALPVRAPCRPLLEVPRVNGPAWRSDGNSTWAEGDDVIELSLEGGLTVSAWVALASPSVEGASLIHLEGPEGEMRLAVGPWREPEFRVGDCSEVTRLLLRPAEGQVALDNTSGSSAPWARDDRIIREIPARNKAEVVLIIDRAAISGTISDQVFGVMIYPQSEEAVMLTIRGDGGSTLREMGITKRK